MVADGDAEGRGLFLLRSSWERERGGQPPRAESSPSEYESGAEEKTVRDKQ